MKKVFSVFSALLLSLLLGQPALSHHSNAMFDLERVIEFSGTIKEFQFTNPHTWVQVVADQSVESSSALAEWSLEWGSPNNLGRNGIRPSSLPAGEKIQVRTNPMKDGSPGGLFVGARLSDGTVVGRWE